MTDTTHRSWLAAMSHPRADPRGIPVPARTDRMAQRAFGRGYVRWRVISPLLG